MLVASRVVKCSKELVLAKLALRLEWTLSPGGLFFISLALLETHHGRKPLSAFMILPAQVSLNQRLCHPLPNRFTVTSPKNNVINHNIRLLALSSLLCIDSMPVKESPFWGPLIPQSLITEATHIIRPGISCCGSFRRKKKESISGSDQMLQLRGPDEILCVTAARVQCWFLWLCLAHSSLWRAGKKKTPTFTDCSKVPLHTASPWPITNNPYILCSSLLLWDFADEEAGSEEMSGHHAAIKG